MPTAAQPRTVTAAELFAMPSDGYRYELVEGNLRMMSPAGGRHGRVSLRIALLLGTHVDEHQLGVAFAAETGFRISSNPDTVLAPDVSFVQAARYEQVEDEVRYLPFAPDLAVEVLSPSDSFTRFEAKALAWLESGCRLVLLVDPETETVHAYRSRSDIRIHTDREQLDCSDVVPAWTLPINKFFQRKK